MNTVEVYRYAQDNPEAMAAGEEVTRGLLARSATDAAFRQRLLAEPSAAIAEFTGRPAPEGMDVRFIENTVDATIVLPDYIDPSAELSEEELEAVAGGDIVAGLVIAAGIATLAAFIVSAHN